MKSVLFELLLIITNQINFDTCFIIFDVLNLEVHRFNPVKIFPQINSGEVREAYNNNNNNNQQRPRLNTHSGGSSGGVNTRTSSAAKSSRTSQQQHLLHRRPPRMTTSATDIDDGTMLCDINSDTDE